MNNIINEVYQLSIQNINSYCLINWWLRTFKKKCFPAVIKHYFIVNLHIIDKFCIKKNYNLKINKIGNCKSNRRIIAVLL